MLATKIKIIRLRPGKEEFMREKYTRCGETVKVKNGVGAGMQTDDMSGQDFIIEDWCENVLGCSWMDANGNPSAIEYSIRTAFQGKNNNVPLFSNDVLYGKIGGLGHLFHVNELNVDN